MSQDITPPDLIPTPSYPESVTFRYQKKLMPMPGFVVMEFPKAQMMAGSIHLVQNIRVEIGRIVAIGDVQDDNNTAEKKTRDIIIKRVKQGHHFPVRWMTGVCYGDNLPTEQHCGDLEWFKDLRVYRFSELLTSIPTEQGEEEQVYDPASSIVIPQLVIAS